MIICGELQSKHFIGGVGSVEHVKKYFLGRWGKQWPDGVILLLSGAGSPPVGTSVVFTSCASLL